MLLKSAHTTQYEKYVHIVNISFFKRDLSHKFKRARLEKVSFLKGSSPNFASIMKGIQAT